jgi:hypothetical protein
MQHLNVAIKYIEHSGKGTERREEVIGKIHAPKYQRRIFFQSYGALRNWQIGV